MRKKVEIEAMQVRVADLMCHADGSRYDNLYGAFRALQWVLGFDRYIAGGTGLEEVLADRTDPPSASAALDAERSRAEQHGPKE